MVGVGERAPWAAGALAHGAMPPLMAGISPSRFP